MEQSFVTTNYMLMEDNFGISPKATQDFDGEAFGQNIILPDKFLNLYKIMLDNYSYSA